MSAGLPVIVSENTGAKEVITNGKEGFVVQIRDARSIGERLSFFNEHRELGISMGLAGAAAVRTLNWKNYQTVCARFYKLLFQ